MWGGQPWGSMVWSGMADDPCYFVSARARVTVSYEFIIFVATEEFATEPDDLPASRPFSGVLQEPLRGFKRSILGNRIGEYASGDGQLVINNVDAAYDYLIKQYAIDGRQIEIKVGRPGIDAYEDYYVVFKGTAADWEPTQDALVIQLRDNGYRLDVPAQPLVYAGTGGAEGSEDLAGKRVPLALGYCWNVTPTLVVPSSRVFQVSVGPINAIPAAYDRASALALGNDYPTLAELIAATTGEGFYDTCLAGGYFKPGSVNYNQITADVQGLKVDGVFLTSAAAIVRYLIGSKTDLVDPDDFDGDSFDAVETAQPAEIGRYLNADDTDTVRDLCAEIMGGIGGWVGFRRSGLVYIDIFTAPSGTPVASFGEDELIGEGENAVRRESLPTGTIPPWRQRVPWRRNWTVQTDVAGSVTAARRAFVAAEYRLAEASDVAVIRDHPNARDTDPLGGHFHNQAAALAEATRQLELFRVVRALYRMRLPRRALLLDIGDIIRVTFDRFDLVGGRLLVVVEITEDLAADQVDVVEVVGYG